MTFRFRHHIIDDDLPGRGYAQTALVDLDGDGRLEYVVGRRYGELYAFKYHAPDRWTRHRIGEDSPSDVGLAVLDVDGDGRPDLITGGAWYRNTGDFDRPFERFVFDPDLDKVHDIVVADLDGDGRPEVLTLADANDLRYYRIADDPTQPWTHQRIGDAVHAGLAVGDLTGNGALDVVRTNKWFENVRGDASTWIEHPLIDPTPPPPDYQRRWTYNATRAVVCDMNADGRMDIVQSDAEIPGGRIWWLENVRGDGSQWQAHEIAAATNPRRGAFHTLHVGDMDGDGDLDMVSCEMEHVRGEAPPRWYIWENLDGRGGQWAEHVILDANLGGHEAVVGDVTGNGKPDIIAKPWRPHPDNAAGGRMFVVFLENVSEQ